MTLEYQIIIATSWNIWYHFSIWY